MPASFPNNMPERMSEDNKPFSTMETYCFICWNPNPGNFWVKLGNVYKGEEDRRLFWRGLVFLNMSDALQRAKELNNALSGVLPRWEDYRDE